MLAKVWKDCTSNPFNIFKKSQTIPPKGSKAYKITQGGGRENVTILGLVNVSGRLLDPVITNQIDKISSGHCE